MPENGKVNMLDYFLVSPKGAVNADSASNDSKCLNLVQAKAEQQEWLEMTQQAIRKVPLQVHEPIQQAPKQFEFLSCHLL